MPAGYAYGRLSSLTRGNGTVESFAYTPASQIASTTRSNDAFAWTGHYNVSRSYTANGLNQYATVGSVTPTYDARGNMTYEGTRTFAFDSANRLTSASGGVTLAYDPSGRLYQTAGAATTKFAYDGADMIAEYNASNQLTRRYVHGPGSDEPLVWYEGSGTTDRRFLHSDERGSVIAITNGSGTVTNVNAYDEYGVPAATNVGRFQYTGQAWLPEIGMYHYKARIYWPQGGRFLQTDPIGYGDGMNLYAYVGGDPVNGLDPSGTSRIDYYRMTVHDSEANGRSLSSVGWQFENSFFAGSLLADGYYQTIPRLSYNISEILYDDDLTYTRKDVQVAEVRGFCESAMTCAMSRDDQAFLSGNISQAAYMDRAEARAAGVAAGAADTPPFGVRLLEQH